MDSSQTKIIEAVNHWLREFIINLNICPFAKVPFELGQVRVSATLGEEFEEQLLFFANELEWTTQNPDHTTLVIFAQASDDFENFLDFVAACEAYLEDQRLSQDYQLVPFHPKFKFEGMDEQERANWVNRSPYPLIHILAREQIAKVLSDPLEGERISKRNEDKLNSLDPLQAKQIKKLHSQD